MGQPRAAINLESVKLWPLLKLFVAKILRK